MVKDLEMVFSRLYVGWDHGGQALAEFLVSRAQKGLPLPQAFFQEVGPGGEGPWDYPDFIAPVTDPLKDPHFGGLLICSTGVGMSIGANRFPHVRGALCLSPSMAKASRAHNQSNLLILGAMETPPEKALEILKVFLTTPFSQEERHIRRLGKIQKLV